MQIPDDSIPLNQNTANFDNVSIQTLNVNPSEKIMNDCNIARESTVVDVGLAAEATAQRIGLDSGARSERIGHHADGTAQRIGIAELDAIGKVESEVCDSSRDIMHDVYSADRHVSGVVERHALHNNDSIERAADKTQGVVQKEAHRTQDELEKFGFRELEAIHGAEKYLYAGMSQNAKEMLLEFERTKLHMKDDHREILLNLKDGNKDLLLQACGNAKDAALAARDLMHQADKNTAAIQLEAFRHKEELARQIAECCCEQKELTREKANETQQLLRDFDKERIKDERDKLREELIALRVRATLPPPLVGSVPL